MSTGMVVARKINQISEESKDFLLVAVVIAKGDAHFFNGAARGSHPATGLAARGVLTLTLRDSERDTINCTIWGTAETVARYDNAFDVGDVVDVVRPLVSCTMYCHRSEQYSPNVTSPYRLTVNEQQQHAQQQAQIVHHEGVSQSPHRSALLRVPVVRPEETIPLADIVASGGAAGSCAKGETFNVLVVVRAVRPRKEVRIGRTNQLKSFREVILIDQSHAGVLMKFWSESNVRRAETWTPLATVLLIADARIEFNEYYRSIGLAVDRRTVITQDPNVPQAEQLLQHARNIPLKDVDVVCSLSCGTVVNPTTITTVMTVQQIRDRTDGALGAQEEQFTALCYAIITRLDLDGPRDRCVSQRCAHCRGILRSHEQSCPKLECPRTTPEALFDLTVDLTDHTGTLDGCRLVGGTAETVLGCDVNTFLRQTTDAQRTELKWRYLLERCAVRLDVKRRSAVRFQPLFSIVACTRADPAEVEAKLKVY